MMGSGSADTVGLVKRRQYRTFVHRMARYSAIRNEAVKRLGHRFHRADAMFQLQLFLLRELAHIAAARRRLKAKGQELGNFGERETTVLGPLDETDAPYRIAIVEPVAAVALRGRCKELFPLVIAQRIGANIRKRGELANGQHGSQLLF